MAKINYWNYHILNYFINIKEHLSLGKKYIQNWGTLKQQEKHQDQDQEQDYDWIKSSFHLSKFKLFFKHDKNLFIR